MGSSDLLAGIDFRESVIGTDPGAGNDLGIGSGRHRQLVLVARLGRRERRRHVEDRVPALAGDHVARDERLAVADAVHGEDDRDGRIAGAQEVAVQRVRGQRADGAARRHQRLRRHLPAEDAPRPPLLVPAAKDVAVDLLDACRDGTVDDVEGGDAEQQPGNHVDRVVHAAERPREPHDERCGDGNGEEDAAHDAIAVGGGYLGTVDLLDPIDLLAQGKL